MGTARSKRNSVLLVTEETTWVWETLHEAVKNDFQTVLRNLGGGMTLFLYFKFLSTFVRSFFVHLHNFFCTYCVVLCIIDYDLHFCKSKVLCK